MWDYHAFILGPHEFSLLIHRLIISYVIFHPKTQRERCLTHLLKAQGDIFKCLLLFDRQSKTQSFSITFHKRKKLILTNEKLELQYLSWFLEKWNSNVVCCYISYRIKWLVDKTVSFRKLGSKIHLDPLYTHLLAFKEIFLALLHMWWSTENSYLQYLSTVWLSLFPNFNFEQMQTDTEFIWINVMCEAELQWAVTVTSMWGRWCKSLVRVSQPSA